MNEEPKSNNNYDIDIINLNNYVIPEIKVSIGTKYILNGDNNQFFKYVEDRYRGSVTNSAIIDKFVYYIIGEGLIDKGGVDINKYISEEDINLICLDFKMHGQYSLQVIWSQGSKILKEEPKPIRFKWIPTSSLGIDPNLSGQMDGYWYSFDWSNKTRYKPRFFPKFDGIYKEGYEIEILTVKRVSQNHYFPFPDYLAGLQYAKIEEENSNGLYNAVTSGFSGLTVINCRGGVPATEELRRETTKKLEEKTTGSNNQSRLVVAYSDSIDTGINNIDVQNFETLDLDKKLQFSTEEAKSKLFTAHKVSNPILFGAPKPSGFGNNAEEMVAAKKEVYSSNINPMRKEIIRGLKFLFKFSEPNIDLEFQDFEDLKTSSDVKK